MSPTTYPDRRWRPRCCPSCGRELESYQHQGVVDHFIVCEPCGTLYVFTDDGVEPVILASVPGEFARVVEELVVSYWRDRQPPVFNGPLGRAA